jgi:hypothetical protein
MQHDWTKDAGDGRSRARHQGLTLAALAILLVACDGDPSGPNVPDPCDAARAQVTADLGQPTRKAVVVDKGKYTETWRYEDANGDATVIKIFQWGGGSAVCTVSAG